MKQMLKKYLSFLLAVLLAGSMLPAALGEGMEETEGNEAAEEIVYPDELIVGNPTITKGDFFTEMFGNDTADIDVRALIHGYNLVNWDQSQGVYVIDESVVENLLVADDAYGNKTYFLGLYEDLYYSDGTPITAWDYAFSLLLMMSHEIEEIGGKIYRSEHILGSREYLQGSVPYLQGVGVIDDHQLAITLDSEFLPYFFEPGLLLCVPYPISVIAPGCKVYAGGEADLGDGYGYGVWIGNEDPKKTEPVFTAELLRRTILDPETGYNSHPAVASGPYRLLSWDGVTAHFEINEYYKGAWLCEAPGEGYPYEIKDYPGTGIGTADIDSHTGPNIFRLTRITSTGEEKSIYLVKPTIRHIAYTVADNDTLADDLAQGKLHLANKVVYGPTIMEITGMANALTPAEEEGPEEDGKEEEEEEKKAETQYQNYPRIGLAFLTFTYENPTVHEMEVRQAMAWCMDRDQMTKDYCSLFGQVVNGYYGIEQWEYLICQGLMNFPVYQEGDEGLTEDEIERLKKHRYRYAATDEEYEELLEAWDALSLDGLTNYNVYDLETDPERTEKTICLAVSPHMKSLGVKNRCRVFEIPKNLEYIKAMPRMQLYIDYSARIYSIYLKYLAPEDIHVYSVDEAFFDGEPYRKLYNMDIPQLTEMIQADVRETTGITSTCGMGTNLYLAKVAMDIMAKHSPGFRAQLDEEEYIRKLGEHRPLRDFWMVGRGTERRLNSVGIFTMDDIRRADRKLLLKLLGRNASYLIDHAFGIETVTMEEIKSYKSPAHSLSSNQVLFRDYDHEEGLIVLKEMVDALTLDLTDAGLVTEDLGLFVGYSEGFSSYAKHFSEKMVESDPSLLKSYAAGSVHLPAATDSRRIITEALERLYLEKVENKFGNNSVLLGMDLLDCGTTRLRNGLIGGHRA